MKALLTYVAILIPGIFVFSQSVKIKEFEKSISVLDPINKVKKMYEFGLNDLNGDTLQSLIWVQKGIDLSNGINNQQLEIEGLLIKSSLQLEYKQDVKALNSCLKVLHHNLDLSDSLKHVLYNNLANALYQLEAYELTVSYRKKILELANTKDYFDKYYVTENIAYCYSKIGEKDSADLYYQKSISLANKTKDTNLILHCNNNTGYHYIVNKEYEKSLKYFEYAQDVFKIYSKRENRDSIIYAMILANNSDHYINILKFNQAKELIYRSNNFLSSSDSSHYIGNFFRLARIHLKSNQIDSSSFYLNLTRNGLYNDFYKRQYHKLKINIARLNENIEKERFHTNAIISLSEEPSKEGLNNLIVELIEAQNEQVKTNLQREADYHKRETELSNVRMWIIVSSAGFVILTLVIFFLFLRKKRREVAQVKLELKEQELSLKKDQASKLEEELKHKNLDLTEFGIELSRKNDFIRIVLEKMKLLEVNNTEEKKELQRQIENHLQVDDSLTIFHENVNKVNHEFMHKLSTNFPNLTTNDKQICALLKLQLSTKEIASLKNISTDSVKKIRYRLRKKMDLDAKTDLSEFFLNY